MSPECEEPPPPRAGELRSCLRRRAPSNPEFFPQIPLSAPSLLVSSLSLPKSFSHLSESSSLFPVAGPVSTSLSSPPARLPGLLGPPLSLLGSSLLLSSRSPQPPSLSSGIYITSTYHSDSALLGLGPTPLSSSSSLVSSSFLPLAYSSVLTSVPTLFTLNSFVDSWPF